MVDVVRVGLVGAVLADHFFVEFDAEAGTGRDRHDAVFDRRAVDPDQGMVLLDID